MPPPCQEVLENFFVKDRVKTSHLLRFHCLQPMSELLLGVSQNEGQLIKSRNEDFFQCVSSASIWCQLHYYLECPRIKIKIYFSSAQENYNTLDKWVNLDSSENIQSDLLNIQAFQFILENCYLECTNKLSRVLLEGKILISTNMPKTYSLHSVYIVAQLYMRDLTWNKN